MGKKDAGSSDTAQNVYIMDKEFAWVPAQVKEMKADTALCRVPVYEEEAAIASDGGKAAKKWREEEVKLKGYPGKSLPMQNVDKNGQLTVVDDMVDLPYLHEAAILYNIKARHVLALPYTRTGDIVIAVNPYQWLTYLYTPEEQKRYADKLVWEAADQDNRKLVPPHVYETSAMCYKGLALDQMNQSILVSGESGAGKTETVKICMNHMAALQAGTTATGDNPVVKRVVESNPLLEAFGNAKTRRNDNSSRFGKYIQLQFEREEKIGAGVPRCILAGSKCEVYLLEKTRITEHDAIERTYHVFYQLVGCKEPDKIKIWPGLKGTTNESFKYVGYTDTTKYEGKEDGDHYYSTVEGLAKVGITEENGKVMMLYRAIAIVLQLGQIGFGAKNGDAEASACNTPKEVAALADLMGIPLKDLEPAICERTMITRGETFKVPLKAELAKDNADAYAKEIYSKVFLWLVREINAATCAEENYSGNRNQNFLMIGLLDIFGFESFPINGFEQLCINYANEKLQQKFTRDIFATVQEEYKFEGIALDDVQYDDNSDVLDLIEGRTGLLAMLNEECVRPKGSDKEFVYKAKEGNKKSACLIADRLLGPLDFGIHHYAGKVVYSAKGFLARNMDTLGDDLKVVSELCSNEIIAKHLKNEAMSWNESEANAAAAAASKGGVKRGKSNIASDTLWTKFRTQLNSLMKNLNTTQSRYVRCVKPNTVKKPLVMFHITTIEQLRCAGVVAAVTISRSAFPNRLDHRSCYERFKVLIKQKGDKNTGSDDKVDFKDKITKMCERVLAPLETDGKRPFVTGKTRIYFRMGALEFLESERQKGFDTWALDVQRGLRGWMIRRTNTSRKMLAKGPQATRLAAWWRCIRAKKQLKKLKKAKKGEAKKKKKSLKAAIIIQAHVRTFLWRPKFKAMLADYREKDSLRNNLKEMEKKLAEAEEARRKEVEEARLKAEAEMEEHRKKMKEEMSNDKEKQKKFAQQQSLIEESGKIIEYLRKENTKLRTQNDTMRKEFKALKENNQRLMEANASASQSFNALNDHAKQLNATNAKLIKNVEAYKVQLEKLKDDLKTRQAYYLAEAEARLTYQKTMAQIVGAIQDKCRDAQLVEDVVIMALECEAEAKAERASLESAAKKAAAAKAGSAPPSAKAPEKSVAKTEATVDSDDDSDDD